MDGQQPQPSQASSSVDKNHLSFDTNLLQYDFDVESIFEFPYFFNANGRIFIYEDDGNQIIEKTLGTITGTIVDSPAPIADMEAESGALADLVIAGFQLVGRENVGLLEVMDDYSDFCEMLWYSPIKDGVFFRIYLIHSIEMIEDCNLPYQLDQALLKKAIDLFCQQQMVFIQPFRGRKSRDYYARMGFKQMGTNSPFLYFDADFEFPSPDFSTEFTPMPEPTSAPESASSSESELYQSD
jgi:hypothetical protein